MKMYGIRGESWIGGRKNADQDNFHWNVNKSKVGDWDHEFPIPSNFSSCIYQNAYDGFFRNQNCSEKLPYICQKKGYSFTIRQLPTSTASTTNPTAITTTTQSINSNCNCGIARRETRIVGGIETEAQEYPWQAALVHPGEKAPWCGGSLVSSQHV